MGAAPEWLWRLLAFCCIAAGIVIVGNSGVVYPHLSNYRQHPIVSALFVGIAGGVLIGTAWFLFALKDRGAKDVNHEDNSNISASPETLKARRATLSKIRDLIFSTKDKPESEKFEPIGALVKYSDEFETEGDVEWVAIELEKHGFGNPFQELEASSQHALRGHWLQFLREARLGTDEIRSVHAALIFAENKWSDAVKFKEGRDAALEQLRTEDRRRIEASGSQIITPSSFGNTEIWVVKKLTVFVRPDAGTAPYTHTVSLITKDALAGAMIDIVIEMPQSANPTIEIRNEVYSGTLLDTISGSSNSKIRQNSSYRFNGRAWSRSSPAVAPDNASKGLSETEDRKTLDEGKAMFYDCLAKIRQGVDPLKALQDVQAYEFDSNDDLVRFCDDLTLHGATNPCEGLPVPKEHWLGFMKVAVGRDLGTNEGLLAALDDVQKLSNRLKNQSQASATVGPLRLRIDALPATPNMKNKTQLAWTLKQKPAFDADCIFSVHNPNLAQGVDGVAFRLLSIQPPLRSARGFDPITEDSKLRRLKFALDTGETLKGDQTGQVRVFRATRHPMGEGKLDNIRIEFGETPTGQPLNQFVPQAHDHTMTVEVVASGLRRTEEQFNIEFSVKPNEPVFTLTKLPS